MAPDYTAYAIANPTLTYGTLAGDYTATRQTGDSASQTLTELKVGLNGYLDAVYTLHTIATPSTISSLTLRLTSSYDNFTDPLKVYVQLNGVWTDITVDILADDAYTPSRATDCIDASGNILVRFTDSVANRREKLDTLSIDQLVADIVVGGSPVNHPPIANDDSASTAVNTPITIDVLANDTEPDNDPVTITLVVLPSNGAATINGNGTITYEPIATHSGPDSFTYSIDDRRGGLDTAVVTITVTAAGNNFVHVGDGIQMSVALAGKSWKATARVTVMDQNNQPAPGATVTGDWLFNGSPIQTGVTAVTDALGIASSTSPPIKATSGNFVFTVTNITLSGYEYVSPTPAPNGSISF